MKKFKTFKMILIMMKNGMNVTNKFINYNRKLLVVNHYANYAIENVNQNYTILQQINTTVIQSVIK